MPAKLIVPVLLNNFDDYVVDIKKQYDVPALSMAILFNGQYYSAATGVLNVGTGVTATTDSIFQIASISKVFTTSLIMQLVDEGRLELELPVKHYLREFTLADPLLSEKITVAQLLNHTNGIPGDFIGNHSYTEQNSPVRYVDRCSALNLIHVPGERYSYSNAGYNIAGRLIEVILGITWFDAIEERIFRPLGMKHAVVHPSQTIKYRAAMGHIRDTNNDNEWTLSPDCCFPICWAPGGSVLTLSAPDLITFAEAHLDHGKTKTGATWLSDTAIELMQEPSIELPPYSPWSLTHCGLGWHLIHGDHSPVVGHYGVGPGQSSVLQLVPEQRFAIAALHNSSNAEILPALLAELLSELADITLPEIQVKPDYVGGLDLESLVGRYETILSAYDVSLEQGKLHVKYMVDKCSPDKAECWTLRAIDHNTFSLCTEFGETERSLSFIDVNQYGKPATLYCKGRLIQRVIDETQ